MPNPTLGKKTIYLADTTMGNYLKTLGLGKQFMVEGGPPLFVYVKLVWWQMGVMRSGEGEAFCRQKQNGKRAARSFVCQVRSIHGAILLDFQQGHSTVGGGTTAVGGHIRPNKYGPLRLWRGKCVGSGVLDAYDGGFSIKVSPHRKSDLQGRDGPFQKVYKYISQTVKIFTWCLR